MASLSPATWPAEKTGDHFCGKFHHSNIVIRGIFYVYSFGHEFIDRAAESQYFAYGARGDVGYGSRGEEHHGDDVGMQAVVGRLHRPFVFEIGGVAHAADDGRGMLVAGEVAVRPVWILTSTRGLSA